jgi:hypothetical protein
VDPLWLQAAFRFACDGCAVSSEGIFLQQREKSLQILIQVRRQGMHFGAILEGNDYTSVLSPTHPGTLVVAPLNQFHNAMQRSHNALPLEMKTLEIQVICY